MKLVHKPLTHWLSIACCAVVALSQPGNAQESPSAAYLAYYQPAKGFKPSQTSLTQIFLQVAGSLEHHGSPVPYIRHMQAEHKRVSTLYEQKTGNAHPGRMPDYMTPEYLERSITNWNALSPKLGLDTLAREVGRCAREGIRGTRDSGTIVVELFNEHQELVMQGMKSGTAKGADFQRLRAKLETELEFNKPEVTLVGYETARRDAVRYALVMEGRFNTLFEKIDAALPPEQAKQVKAFVKGAFIDLARLAHSEFEIGILEWSLRH